MKRLLHSAALITLLAWSSPSRGELVTNGGFETGDITGWTLQDASVGTAINLVDGGIDYTAAHSGTYYIWCSPA